ncbi:MAG: membrane protein insertion efficiency factor YidD [bacterium]|nr:membrane protein insertion efficiency factor YidD [bacterium]
MIAFLRRVWVAPVRFYQRFLSPLKPPTCRFHPSCSEYAVQAVLTHGILRGTWMATWRLARCHPFACGGHDPVPPRS